MPEPGTLSPVPEAVREAARNHPRTIPVTDRAELRRFDVRVIKPPEGKIGGARLGLVLATHLSDRPYVEIALVHTYLDQSTSIDAVVPSEVTGCPYALVVETDLRGVVWADQVSKLTGEIGIMEFGAMVELLDGDGHPEQSYGITVGTPLRGVSDQRWGFKVEEGDALDRLTSDCTHRLLTEMDAE